VGDPKSGEALVAYATRGCDGRDGRSCGALAWAHFVGVTLPRDWPRAAQYNELACEYGYPVGCNSLGLAYRDGHGVTADPVRAMDLFAKSCDGGSALGCASLAMGTPDGMVPEDRAAKALPVLVSDCDPRRNPDLRVCTVAARMFENGRGSARDLDRARSLYGDACDRGDPDACDRRRRF
jgi:TPR repeat protein